eukprot:TRINITY_DN14204_c0_g1_i2.p1 TRINITY_DN14204_c0_g1~~TRINITY_DN14204_c0_g1_i2.p1  ORF type:complete len:398 (+),score=70.10 TRINITY_DN14204_c0_g1_i2:60-1196(+)
MCIRDSFYTNKLRSKLTFVCAHTDSNKTILQSIKALRRGEFKPTFWMPFAWMQIIYGSEYDPTPYIPFTREDVTMSDNGTISLDWAEIPEFYQRKGEESVASQKICVITHGLTGGSDCNYVRLAVKAALKGGFRAVVVNARGLGENKLSTWKPQNISSSDDLAEALDFVQKKFPDASIYGIGISMGALIMLTYIGKAKEQSKIKAAVSIANPFDLAQTTKYIAQRPFWNYHITTHLQAILNKNADVLKTAPKELNIDWERARKAWTTAEFDEAFTRRILGFTSLDAYYNEINCIRYLKDITVPVLCINSLDDPLSDPRAIPKEEFYKNENLILVLTSKGGHIDWFTGRKPRRWIYWPTVDYLNYVAKHHLPSLAITNS